MLLYKRIVGSLCLGFVFFIACSSDNNVISDKSSDEYEIPEQDEEGNVYMTTTFDGESRAYIVHIPSSYDASKPIPLVISLHGFGTTNQVHMDYTGFNKVADTHKFIIVYPMGLIRDTVNGRGNHWNAEFGSDVDDVGFMNHLIDKMYTDFNIDLKKIYVNGFSNGGFMSYVLACELSDRIAAIASVAGLLPIAQQNNCTLSHKIPVLQIHGNNDEIVPVTGFPNFALSLTDTMNYFLNKNNCSVTDFSTQEINGNSEDNSIARRFDYNTCVDDTKVVYYLIENAGHTWPDALEAGHLGITNRDFNGAEEIWKFCSQFVHPNPRAGTKLD